MNIKAANKELPEHFIMEWQRISTAPFDRDLELAVIDASGIHPLVFPCRRVLHGWIRPNMRLCLYTQHTGASGMIRSAPFPLVRLLEERSELLLLLRQ
jgi:hypothetical protein